MAEFVDIVKATMKLNDDQVRLVLDICKEDKFFIALYPRFSDRVIGVIQYLDQSNN